MRSSPFILAAVLMAGTAHAQYMNAPGVDTYTTTTTTSYEENRVLEQPGTLDGQLRRMQAGQPAPAQAPVYAPAPVAAPAQAPVYAPAPAYAPAPVAAPAPAYAPAAGYGAQPAESYVPVSNGADYVAPQGNLLKTTANGINYATGGVGEEELAQIKSLEKQFNLKMLTTMKDGSFVGNYTMRITDAQNAIVLEAPGDGPYFYAGLPKGTYTVTVSDPTGVQGSQKVTVGSGMKTLHFRW